MCEFLVESLKECVQDYNNITFYLGVATANADKLL